jgi:hypothetical protein
MVCDQNLKDEHERSYTKTRQRFALAVIYVKLHSGRHFHGNNDQGSRQMNE